MRLFKFFRCCYWVPDRRRLVNAGGDWWVCMKCRTAYPCDAAPHGKETFWAWFYSRKGVKR